MRGARRPRCSGGGALCTRPRKVSRVQALHVLCTQTGIPKFYRWLSERYPLLNQRFTATEGAPDIDNLYLDMNGIIHNSTHANQKDVKFTEEEMMLRICDYIDKLVQIIRPQKLLFMAIDGALSALSLGGAAGTGAIPCGSVEGPTSGCVVGGWAGGWGVLTRSADGSPSRSATAGRLQHPPWGCTRASVHRQQAAQDPGAPARNAPLLCVPTVPGRACA